MHPLTIVTIVLASLAIVFGVIFGVVDIPGLGRAIVGSLALLFLVGAFAFGPFRWIFQAIARRTG